ncbi:NAD(P)-binding protein [Nakamurella sp. YIM 132087]|uniref:NAD(P)-binding protein n=1 Tax=Nakamurella alba TaxID=2665158 RepID=A0A7K1FEM2_9ACTN|nr:NAD(P)/FAD-dependent oxidoreductase [Nakamurella alba]MTD12548.1 NAD(P)-binding protein [Nakamurella alba]
MNSDFVDLLNGYGVDADGLRTRYDNERDARERPDAVRQFVKVDAEFSHYVDDPYAEPLDRMPIEDQDTDAVVIGAGFGGLLAAGRLRQAGLQRIRLVERGGDVGGTWYWNRYPGVQCDIDSYVYLPLLEETGYLPTLKYAYGQEIFTHARRIAQHFGLYPDALFQTGVTDLQWQDDKARWLVETDRGDRIEARHVVVANGALSRAKLPGIPGIESFQGHTFHTSRWDYAYTGGDQNGNLDRLSDKRVGIIGTGATSIQVVPHLAESAREVYVFQRTPSVVGPRNNRPTDPVWAVSLQPGWQRERMENFTDVVYGVRDDVDLVSDSWTELNKAITGTAATRAERRLGRTLSADERKLAIEFSDLRAGNALRDRIETLVEDPATAERLKAWYYLYCKRPCFHDGYLPAFNRPNVTLVQTAGTGVDRLTERGVVVGDREYQLDCLIFASGFEVATSFVSQTGFDPVGIDGVRLSDHWVKGPRTLHGMQASGFPNLFFMGIVQNSSTLNFTHMLAEQAGHIADVVARSVRRRQPVTVTAESEQAWLDEMLAFAGDAEVQRWLRCTPSYLNGDGDVENAFGFLARRYAGGPQRFFRLLEQWRTAEHPEGLVYL